LECWHEFFRINQIDPNERSNLNNDEREWLDKVLLSRNELLEKFAELNEQVAAAENAGVSIDENELSNITTSVQNYFKETNADMVSSEKNTVSLQGDGMIELVDRKMMFIRSSSDRFDEILQKMNDMTVEITRLKQESNRHEKRISNVEITLQNLLDLSTEQMGQVRNELDSLHLDMGVLVEMLPLIKSIIHSQQMLDKCQMELSLIKDDPYKASFHKTLTRDLNYTYSAAAVVQTDIVQNVKVGTLGKIGNVIKVLGNCVPTFGGAVQFFGTILAAVDSATQTIFVRNLAKLVSSASEMEEIASSVGMILSGDSFDKSPLDSESSTMDYLTSSLDFINDSLLDDIDDTSLETSLASVGKNLVAKIIAEVSTMNNGLLFKKKKSQLSELIDPEQQSQALQELVDLAESHANIISTLIITAIFQGKISSDHSSSSKQTAEKIIVYVFNQFGQQVPDLTGLECSKKPYDAWSVPEAHPSPAASRIGSKAQAVAEEILLMVESDVTLTTKLQKSFVLDISNQLQSTKTSSGKKLMDSLILSDNLKHAYVKVLSNQFATKLLATPAMTSMSLSFLRIIFEETENEIRYCNGSYCRNDGAGDLSVW